jgi:phosphoserine phosphatase RsbU/P
MNQGEMTVPLTGTDLHCGRLGDKMNCRRDAMATHSDTVLRAQLATRKQKLESTIASSPGREYLANLLREVDTALIRLDSGTFGLCEACHSPLETDRLAADPLVRFCTSCLTPVQQQALVEDLELASRIQAGLLPRNDLVHNDWRAAYHYEPAGQVSGDYCDLVTGENGNLYFMLGDVSGKGIPASMLMAHLHAMFRVLIGVGLPLVQMVERASRVFCESTLATHYATLICGRAGKDGEVEICNAGHLPVLLLRAAEVNRIEATGLPLGMFCSAEFTADCMYLNHGDRLVLFTDGISESQNRRGTELGIQPLIQSVKERPWSPARKTVLSIMTQAEEFRGGNPATDDQTVMVIERCASQGKDFPH